MKATKKENKKRLSHYGFEENKIHYWWASWYSNILGYSSLSSFNRVLRKAKNSCAYLGLSLEDNFIKTKVNRKTDYKLSRIACLLLALHADQRKKQVKKARNYFIKELKQIDTELNLDSFIDRIMANESLIRLQQLLCRVATWSGVKDHRYFNNQGYLGLYEKNATDLRTYRAYKAGEDLSDHMTLTELLANMMRVNLTIEALKAGSISSEKLSSVYHHRIAKKIRNLIKASTGKFPEQLPIKSDLKTDKSKLKRIVKSYNKYINNELSE